jgi:hypothetical protein
MDWGNILNPDKPENPELPIVVEPEVPVIPVETNELSGLKWQWGNGFNASNAKRDENAILTFKSVNNDGIKYTCSSLKHWVKVSGADFNSIACLVNYTQGWVAKFEWAPDDRTYRGWENVKEGYGGIQVPKNGDKCGLVLVESSKKRHSNVILFTWGNW